MFFFSKVKEILELSPSLQNTPDVLLGLCNMKTKDGRQLCAKALCHSIWIKRNKRRESSAAVGYPEETRCNIQNREVSVLRQNTNKAERALQL